MFDFKTRGLSLALGFTVALAGFSVATAASAAPSADAVPGNSPAAGAGRVVEKVEPAARATLKIGVVNMERILREAKLAIQASDRLNAEGQRRQEEIEALSRRFKSRLERYEKNAADMDESARVQERRALAEMERDVTRRTREAREEFNQRRNEEVLLLQSRAARIVQDIAKKDKFDLVLYEYFYASDRVDLTRRVIDELDRGVKGTPKK